MKHIKIDDFGKKVCNLWLYSSCKYDIPSPQIINEVWTLIMWADNV